MAFEDMPTEPEHVSIKDFIKKLPNLIDEGQANLCPWIVGIGVLVCGLVVAGFASYYNRNLLMDLYQSGRDRLNEWRRQIGEDENDHSD